MDQLLGLDIGSSSVKAALLDAATGRAVATAVSPKREMAIAAPHPDWAEQDPDTWWLHVCRAVREVMKTARCRPAEVKGIGLAYQMHGLVAVDSHGKPVRPAILWCDSRAVRVGEELAAMAGPEKCRQRLLNLPGNFTASKLAWVRQNEPRIFSRIARIMLPGDYVAMKLTGEITTTPGGLSEGILWDFQDEAPAGFMLEAAGIPANWIPPVVGTFSMQGRLTATAAKALGLCRGTPLGYRAGDQPNNAFSLQVLHPGEAAVTAGTSGVVYGVADRVSGDPAARVNVFAHVNHSVQQRRHGVLLCLNGAGILNSWLRRHLLSPTGAPLEYARMNRLAATVPIGADGLVILPYGNGAERTLGNRDPGASVCGWRFNTHGTAHFCRAAQEGVVFALNYGLDMMRAMGLKISHVRAGQANLFLSPLFAQAFATVSGATVHLLDTNGAIGSARGAGVGMGLYASPEEAFTGLRTWKTIEPDPRERAAYADAYERWKEIGKT
jgi:xylulokinase